MARELGINCDPVEDPENIARSVLIEISRFRRDLPAVLAANNARSESLGKKHRELMLIAAALEPNFDCDDHSYEDGEVARLATSILAGLRERSDRLAKLEEQASSTRLSLALAAATDPRSTKKTRAKLRADLGIRSPPVASPDRPRNRSATRQSRRRTA